MHRGDALSGTLIRVIHCSPSGLYIVSAKCLAQGQLRCRTVSLLSCKHTPAGEVKRQAVAQLRLRWQAKRAAAAEVSFLVTNSTTAAEVGSGHLQGMEGGGTACCNRPISLYFQAQKITP